MLFATYHNHKNTKRSKIRKTSVFSRISLTLQQICKTDAKSLYSKRFKVKKHAFCYLSQSQKQQNRREKLV